MALCGWPRTRGGWSRESRESRRGRTRFDFKSSSEAGFESKFWAKFGLAFRFPRRFAEALYFTEHCLFRPQKKKRLRLIVFSTPGREQVIFVSFTSVESVARCGRSRRNSERRLGECTLSPNTRTFASWNLQKRCSLRTPHTNRSVFRYGNLEELHRAGFVGSAGARSIMERGMVRRHR